MREIKFRAWGHFGSNTKDSMIENWQSSEYVEYVGFNGGESFTIMQFTGLKDKNGKEIYEGDVTEYKAWTGLDRGEIVWGEKECAFFWEGRTDCQPLGDIYQDIKIIGSIYENPDLLE